MSMSLPPHSNLYKVSTVHEKAPLQQRQGAIVKDAKPFEDYLVCLFHQIPERVGSNIPPAATAYSELKAGFSKLFEQKEDGFLASMHLEAPDNNPYYITRAQLVLESLDSLKPLKNGEKRSSSHVGDCMEKNQPQHVKTTITPEDKLNVTVHLPHKLDSKTFGEYEEETGWSIRGLKSTPKYLQELNKAAIKDKDPRSSIPQTELDEIKAIFSPSTNEASTV
ncbi:MAG: hypothetical protein HEQ32_06900 [Vampirovibrio sp.]